MSKVVNWQRIDNLVRSPRFMDRLHSSITITKATGNETGFNVSYGGQEAPYISQSYLGCADSIWMLNHTPFGWAELQLHTHPCGNAIPSLTDLAHSAWRHQQTGTTGSYEAVAARGLYGINLIVYRSERGVTLSEPLYENLVRSAVRLSLDELRYCGLSPPEAPQSFQELLADTDAADDYEYIQSVNRRLYESFSYTARLASCLTETGLYLARAFFYQDNPELLPEMPPTGADVLVRQPYSFEEIRRFAIFDDGGAKREVLEETGLILKSAKVISVSNES